MIATRLPMMLLLCCSCCVGMAQQPQLNLDPAQANSLLPYAQYFRDYSKTMELSAIKTLEAERWQAYEGTLYPQKSTVWLRFQVPLGEVSRQQWLLDTQFINANEIEVFAPEQHWLTGDLFGFHHRPLPYRFYVFPLQLKGEQTLNLYLRIVNDYVIRGSTNLIQPDVLVKNELNPMLFKFVVAGILFMLFLFNTFLLLIFRHTTYQLYSIILFISLFIQFSISGHDFQFLWPNWSWLHLHIRYEFFCLYAIFVAFFSLQFLPVRDLSRVGYYLVYLCVAGLAACLVLPLLGFYEVYAALSLISGLLLYFVLAAIGLVAWYRGVDYAKYYVFAWSGLFVVTIWLLLAIVNRSVNQMHAMALDVGVISQALFVSLALAARMKRFEHDAQLARVERSAKANFLAKMSHEIRTPINGILGMTALLSERLSQAAAKQFNQGVDQSARQLLLVINNILDFSQLEAGKLALHKSNHELLTFCEECINTVCFEQKTYQHNVVLCIDNSLAKYWQLDAAPVALLLRTLLTKVVKQALSDVLLQVQLDKNNLLFRIESQCLQGQLEQSLQTQDDDELGGAILQQLCALLGTKLQHANAGKVCWFTLAAQPQASQSKTLDYPMLRDKRVLLVDQSDLYSRQFVALSRQLRMQVIRVPTAQAAIDQLQLLDISEIDLLLVDHKTTSAGFNQLWQQAGFAARVPSLWLHLRSDSSQSLSDMPLAQQHSKPCSVVLLCEPINNLLQPIAQKTEVLSQVLNVLVAEDNRVNQLVISGLLKRLKHKVTIVNNGEEAVNAITLMQRRFDCVLMDCEMPVLDGMEATRQIRQWELSHQTHPVPIVGLSAHRQQEHQTLCQSVGMTGYLCKPISPLDLEQALAKRSG